MGSSSFLYLLPLLLLALQDVWAVAASAMASEEEASLLEIRGKRSGSVKRPLLVIHAGLHKTGTTSLQLSMNSCSDWASSMGVTSLVLEGQPKKVNHNFLVHFAESVGQELPLYKETLELRNESAYLRTWEKLRDCEERHFAGLAPCRALLSSELFTEAQLPVWQALFEKLPKWDIRVLVFHRYYPAWLLSLYGEYQRDYMVDTAHNPMSLLEFALEGPGAQLSPRRTLERIQDALSACKGGDTAQCSVQGASYDLFQHQGYDQYEYVVLNVTMDLHGQEFLAANRSLWQTCPHRSFIHASPPNLTLAVDIVRLLKNSHEARGCTSQFQLSASNREVLELANKDVLPVACMDIGNLLADDSARWFENAHVTPPTYHKDSQFCQIKQQALKPEHWKVMHALTGNCRSRDGDSSEESSEPETLEGTKPKASARSQWGAGRLNDRADRAESVWSMRSTKSSGSGMGGMGMLSQGAHLTLDAKVSERFEEAEADPGRSFFVQSPQAPMRSASPALDLSGVTGVDFSERGSSLPLPALPKKRLFGDEAFGEAQPQTQPLSGVEESESFGANAAPAGGLGGLFGLPLETSQLQLSSEPVVLPQARGLNDYDESDESDSPRVRDTPKKGEVKRKSSSPRSFQGQKGHWKQKGAGAGAGGGTAKKGQGQGHLPLPSKPFAAEGASDEASEAAEAVPSAFPKVVLPPIRNIPNAPTAKDSSQSLLDHLEGLPTKKPGVPGMAGVFSDDHARPILRAPAPAGGS